MTTKIFRRGVLAAAGLAAPDLAGKGWAQSSYPNRPIRIVVPFSPGGTTDLLARIAGQHLSDAWGQPVVVENRSGAGGNIGAEFVAKAPPDGYTLLFATVGALVTNQYLYRQMPYDSATAFAPVALFGEVANVLAVHPSLPVNSVSEYVELCKARGAGGLSFGSPAIGGSGHLAMAYLEFRAGFKVEHVVYRGSSDVLKDLLAGHIPSTMDNLPPYLPHFRTGALRPLGVTSSRRSPAIPELPTIAEQGYAGFDAAPWWHVSAPAGTPTEILRKLSDELVRAMTLPDVIRRVRESGASELGGSGDELAQRIVTETPKWRQIVAAAGLEPQ
ncbi:tripartite tricarboxylate transporter substrate binding protein [Roseococcus sp. SYP-B2431]|uniref:Bug family tripartite tricarboxylate transporter substrate binding protein n=1 Tax=Roseococcus sp. SYP-B2431 TaxID=2496640 RepID=UPI00103D05F7|nr:tripartite tricarboxylate transporter substrate binding protein [Roseococcus sp. SYP-B2431]TCH98340.1 tripartite tricarboxylate transporter substrate binding protein [Roseococcus sp. SYP-B2431]